MLPPPPQIGPRSERMAAAAAAGTSVVGDGEVAAAAVG